MRTHKIFSLAICSLALTAISYGQTKTETFKVSGNCGMCKSNIEKAAKAGGAQTAVWNVDTKEITITYSSQSTNTAKIQQKIAKAGYDNEGAKAKDEDYKKLHGCCQYERNADEDCCMKNGEKADCCKDGKCTKPGHEGKDCCKKE